MSVWGGGIVEVNVPLQVLTLFLVIGQKVIYFKNPPMVTIFFHIK